MKLIPLTKGYFTKVDNKDFKKFAVLRWCVIVDKRNKKKIKVRAFRREKGKTVYLSRKILDAPKGVQVDHKNRDTLDNRRKNLRLCSPSQNQQNSDKYENNTLGYKGVFLDKRDNKYFAQIQTNKKRKYLGRFDTAELAAKTYNRAAKKSHKEYAVLNKI